MAMAAPCSVPGALPKCGMAQDPSAEIEMSKCGGSRWSRPFFSSRFVSWVVSCSLPCERRTGLGVFGYDR